MKKFISALLAVVMILSFAAVVSLPASAAVEGDWMIYSTAAQYRDDYEGDYSSVIGYEYTNEGLKVLPADWRDFGPAGGIQTKRPYDVKEGVYMLVRVDEFSFDAGDEWLNMNLWSQQMLSPGSNDVDKYGFGLQTLVRTDDQGNITTLWWHTGGFDSGARSTITGETLRDENGKLLLEFTVTWDGTTFAADINGWEAPESVINYMNDTFDDMEAFVGFNFMAGKKGGVAEMTILKFGTSKEDARVPLGSDAQDPVNRYIEIAEIADADTVEPGMPGVLLNGSRDFSDAKTNTGISGSKYRTRNDDWSVTYLSDKSILNASYSVANDVSYDIQDFPIALVLTRNYCSCEEEDGEVCCYAVEEVWAYIMTGEFTSADDDHKTMLEVCYEPIVDDDGNSYLYFFCDMSNEDYTWDAEGRIHGIRADFYGIYYNEPGRNTLDVCFMAFFRNLEEAQAYIYDYVGIGDVEENTTDPEDTTVVLEETTAAPEQTTAAPEQTTAAPEQTTAAPEQTTAAPEQTTAAPEQTTAAPEQTTAAPEQTTDNNVDNSGNNASGSLGGCGSVVGFGAITVVAIACAVSFVSFKKKED